MDALALIEGRASVRRFAPEPIPEADLERILAAAQRAPTDAGAQLYSILRVRDPALRRRLAEVAGGQPHVEEAPEFFVLLADLHRVGRVLELAGHTPGHFPRSGLHFAVIDAALAGAFLELAARALGYGAVWVGGLLNEAEALVRLLALPPGVFPVAGLAIGRPAEAPRPRPRLPGRLVVHTDRYQAYEEAALAEALSVMGTRWLRVLAHYFGREGVMEARDPAFGRAKAKQGFADDLTASAAALLESGSLGEAIQELLGSGWRGVLFGADEVWIEAEDRAFRGEGKTPGEALAQAVRASREEGSFVPFERD